MAIPAPTALMPTFPLSSPPLCKNKSCDLPCVRAFTAKGRPVYGCPCQPKGVWCTYDDDEGVSSENPACSCGYFCRKDFSAKSRKEFLKCAVGSCEVFMWLDPATNASAAPFQSSLIGEALPHAQPVQTPVNEIDGEFVRLLRHVEAVAPTASFPSQSGISDVTTTESQAQRSPVSFQIRSSHGLERNEKIGAAGEYFVLLHLHHALNGQIDGRHWRSRTRNAVKNHLGHSDWPEYTEDEDDADIVFYDEHSLLTNLLIVNGYLDPQHWNGRQVNYLIEVKSTLGGRTREFFISPKQFYRMQESSQAPQTPTLYIIARVSNLQETNIDLRLYVDPESMRKSGQLSFEQLWRVRDPRE